MSTASFKECQINIDFIEVLILRKPWIKNFAGFKKCPFGATQLCFPPQVTLMLFPINYSSNKEWTTVLKSIWEMPSLS